MASWMISWCQAGTRSSVCAQGAVTGGTRSVQGGGPVPLGLRVMPAFEGTPASGQCGPGGGWLLTAQPFVGVVGVLGYPFDGLGGRRRCQPPGQHARFSAQFIQHCDQRNGTRLVGHGDVHTRKTTVTAHRIRVSRSPTRRHSAGVRSYPYAPSAPSFTRYP